MIQPRKLEFVSDEPTEENLQFKFDEHAETISKFLADEDTPRPFVIGIDGEWGSGKTTFLKAIKRKLEKRNTDEAQKIIEFDSWKYERSDIFASLLWEIGEKFNKTSQIEKNILKFGCDVLSRKIAGMSLSEVENHFKGMSENTRTIKDKLDKLVNKKTVLFIDDLDRCNAENMLEMLENIKWFLTIKNIIVVIVVDMDIVEKAWGLRYGIDWAKEIGRNHTEKMFQLRIPVPTKSDMDLITYVSRLTKSLDENEIRFFVELLPPNPRKIKLALNSFHLALHNRITEYFVNTKSKVEYIQILMLWIAIAQHHHDIAEVAKISPHDLLSAALICSYATSQSELHDLLEQYDSGQSPNNQESYKLRGRVMINHKDMSRGLLSILKICMAEDRSAFDILKHYGHTIDEIILKRDKTYAFSKLVSRFDNQFEILKSVVYHTAL